jgi:serine/threonine protein kinase
VVRGSIGYLDPQYFLTGVFSAKSDVYSYGVVLLELISGHQAIHNAASLASWAAPYLTSPSLYPEMVDKKLNGKFEQDELESLVDLSKMCMQEDSKMRPNMRQVVAFLNARQLEPAGGESSEQVTEETISREAYHKMHPLFIDFEAVATKESSGSSDNIFASPRPRD